LAFFQQAPNPVGTPSSIGITWPSSFTGSQPAGPYQGPFIFGAPSGTLSTSAVVVGSLTNSNNSTLVTANANFTSANSGNVVTIDANGNAQSSGVQVSNLLAGSVQKQLGADFSNSNGILQTFQSVSIAQNQSISFDCRLLWKQTSTSGQLALAVTTQNFSAANIQASVQMYYDLVSTGAPLSTMGTITASGSSGQFTSHTPQSISTFYRATLFGTVESASANGTLQIQAAGVTAGTGKIARGSYCEFFF
jgi:hypothetical protein